MERSIWRTRGVRLAITGTVLAMALSLVGYLVLPETVVQHGTFAEPDAWTSRGRWLLFQLTFLPGMAAFLMLMVIGTTGAGPGSLNVNDPAKLAYWAVPERWPTARRRLVDVMGVFVAGLEIALAVMLVVGAGGQEWGLPFWLSWAGPLVVILALTGWLCVALNRALRVPTGA